MFIKESNRKINSDLEEHLKEFPHLFSLKQKKAVLFSLIVIANVDGDFDPREQKFLFEISGILGYELTNDGATEIANMDQEVVIKTLATLGSEQKDWLIITLYAMIKIDEIKVQSEIDVFLYILEQLRISQDYAVNLISKTQAILKDMGL